MRDWENQIQYEICLYDVPYGFETSSLVFGILFSWIHTEIKHSDDCSKKIREHNIALINT